MLRSTQTRYGAVAVTLHWLIAIGIIGMLTIGKYMVDLPDTDADKFPLYQLHKSFGISILVLSVARLVWRLTNRVPDLPPAMPAWERWAAHATHALFYMLIIAIPFTGWAVASSSPYGIPTVWFGLFEIPHIPGLQGFENQRDIERGLAGVHELLGNLMILLLLLHVGAALKHHFWNRDNVLVRMLPFTRVE